MLPVKNISPEYRTLEEIRQRKDQLLDELQKDNEQFTGLWNSVFVKREGNSKGDYIASLVTNGVTVIDLILLFRKLRKNYGSLAALFGKGKKKR